MKLVMQKAKTTQKDVALEILWREFGNVCIDESENIESSFLHFEGGTNRDDVWHWFDSNHSIGVGYLMNRTA